MSLPHAQEICTRNIYKKVVQEKKTNCARQRVRRVSWLV